jgi:hypothetical protein
VKTYSYPVERDYWEWEAAVSDAATLEERAWLSFSLATFLDYRVGEFPVAEVAQPCLSLTIRAELSEKEHIAHILKQASGVS